VGTGLTVVLRRATATSISCFSPAKSVFRAGVISKAALAAAFLAADEGAPIGMRHLLRALRREVSSLGIAVPALLTVKPA
jgi:hypothetical protein